jgi:hypothetical protein
MAKSYNNMATLGLSGALGPFVFSQRNGKTIVSPRTTINKPANATQLVIRNIFKKAVSYGRAVMNNPVLLAFYMLKAKRGITPYNLAVADYCKAPDIENIDAAAYNGSIGSLIKIAATDNGKVDALNVRIERSNGSLVEEGQATDFGDGLHFVFSASATNTSLAGSIITITARDLAGRESVKSLSL